MFVSNLQLFRFRGARVAFGLAVVWLGVLGSSLLVAQGTHLWTQSRMEEFERGVPQGVSVSSDGHLYEGPGLTELLTTPSSYVWSVAAGANGEAFVGTASPATVLRVGKDGKAVTLFETKDVSVQVVKLGPDGALYVATLPSGKVYRLKADATEKQDEASAAVVFDLGKVEEEKPGAGAKAKGAKTQDAKADADKTDSDKADAGKSDSDKSDAKSHYIWDLTFDSAGQLYIATGGPGAIYRMNPAKADSASEVFFKSDEQHLRCLAWDAKGNLLAGSDGSGLVYRIDKQGKGYVLFEAPRREITSIAVGANGTIYAASVGDKSHNPLPPLPIQGIGSVTITVVQPGSLTAANSSTSVPEGSEIYAITAPDDAKAQAPRRLWAGKDEVVYSLAAGADGLLALTGNRGRIFKIQDDGSYADVAHLDAQQGLSMVALPGAAGTARTFLIGTGNTGKLVKLGALDKHEYASDVLDTGALARFGRVEVEPGSNGFDLFTRSGNVEQPVRGRGDWGWSEWQAVKDGEVASPAGRFFEWKAVLRTGGRLGGVGVNYLPVNAAPVVDELVVATGARVNAQAAAQAGAATVSINFPSAGQGAVTFDANAAGPLQAMKDRTAVTVRWAAHDDNGDDLTYALYLRGDGETTWRLLKDQITDKAYSFDSTLIPDGGYEVRVVVSDAPSHTPAAALTGVKESERFEVDTTPPVVSGLKAEAGPGESVAARGVEVIFEAEDAASPVAHAEYAVDAGTWQYIEPQDGISDAKREHYDFRLPAAALEGKAGEHGAGEHLITVRVYDRHENVGVAKTLFRIPAK